jgi:hypothetical protein
LDSSFLFGGYLRPVFSGSSLTHTHTTHTHTQVRFGLEPCT